MARQPVSVPWAALPESVAIQMCEFAPTSVRRVHNASMRCFPLESARAVLRYHDLPGRIDCPLVFIHGLGCASSSDYPQVAMEPALSNRRRLLVDLLGAGFSDRPPDFPYTVGSHAHCLAEFIEGLGPAQIDLFGHSEDSGEGER